MLIYGRNPHNIVKQLSSSKKKKSQEGWRAAFFFLWVD